MDEVSGVFCEKRESAGESLTQTSVEQILCGGSLELKVCQAHFQAFYKTSKQMNFIECPLCMRRVPRNDTSPLETLQSGMDEAERIVVLETAMAITP